MATLVASDAARCLTGQVLAVDGGVMICNTRHALGFPAGFVKTDRERELVVHVNQGRGL